MQEWGDAVTILENDFPERTNRMKVLHVISGDLWAGAEVQAFTLLKTLKQHCNVDARAVLLNDSILAERLRAYGIGVSVLPESKLDPMTILLKLRTLLLKFRPDIVHTHRVKENILGSVANALSIRAPCIRTVHGSSEHAFLGIRNLPKRIVRRADEWAGKHLQQKIIAVSRALATELSGRFGDQHVVTIENGVDVEELRATAQVPAFRHDYPKHAHIGIVGRLVPVKRVDMFLEMARLLCAHASARPWRFHIFGDGPLLQKLQERAVQLGLSSCTEFHGHRDDVPSCITGLDALVLCSDHEGLPMTALESLAVGTPVVAHSVGGLVDVLSAAGARNRLVRDHNPSAYATAVLQTLEGGTNSDRASFPERFTARYNTQRTLDLYTTLTSNH